MSFIRILEQEEPETPPSGRGVLYIDVSDSHIKFKDATGTVFDLNVGSDGDWTSLVNTPGSISPGLVVQGNPGGTDLEFGQGLNTTDIPTFEQIIIGVSVPFLDTTGTLTLQNVDSLDATTNTTIEDAINTLTNLSSVQGQTISLSGGLTVEAQSILNQDLTTDADSTFKSLLLSGVSSEISLSLDSTVGAFLVNRLTTAQRDALTGTEGMQIYNSTLSIPEFYNGTNWKRMGGAFPVVDFTGTSKNLVIADNEKFHVLSNVGTITVTIPDNAAEPFPIGAEMAFLRGDSGTVIFAIPGSDDLDSRDSLVTINAQHSAVTLKKINTTKWVLIGDLA